MKKYFFILLLFLIIFKNEVFAVDGDQQEIDSLVLSLSNATEDLARYNILHYLIYMHTNFKPEEGLKYCDEFLKIAEKTGVQNKIANAKISVGRIYWKLGRFDEALKHHFDALKIFEAEETDSLIATSFTCIGQDYADSGNYPEARKYFLKALKIYEDLQNKSEMANIYNLLSWLYNNEGNNSESSRMNFKSLKIYEELGMKYEAAISMTNLASDHAILGNYEEALKYFQSSIKPMENVDNQNLSITYNSIGDIYLKMNKYDESYTNHTLALKIGKKINDKTCIANALSGIGEIYFRQEKYNEALTNYLEAVELLKSVSNKQVLAKTYNKIGTCYFRLHDYEKAYDYFNRVYELSKDLGSILAITDYYKGIEMIDSANCRWKDAYFNYKNFIINYDSIYSQENTKKMVQAQMHYESDKKDAAEKVLQEKKDIRQRTIRNSIAAGLAGSLIFLVVVYRQRNRISKEKKRSEELLLNILPAETAEELKATGTTKAKDYNEVTVLFTDFKNFTLMSEKLNAQELVNEINYCYSAFDNIITKYGIEKIKTIGDSYMCAAGLPIESANHAQSAVEAALEIRTFVENEKQKRMSEGNPFFEIRIGLNSGPVVAGIVGIKKFAYDIWGDTVNIASRMESSGEIGKVNISGSTYDLIKDKFSCTHRGKIHAKNKGEIDMYFVEHM